MDFIRWANHFFPLNVVVSLLYVSNVKDRPTILLLHIVCIVAPSLGQSGEGIPSFIARQDKGEVIRTTKGRTHQIPANGE